MITNLYYLYRNVTMVPGIPGFLVRLFGEGRGDWEQEGESYGVGSSMQKKPALPKQKARAQSPSLVISQSLNLLVSKPYPPTDTSYQKLNIKVRPHEHRRLLMGDPTSPGRKKLAQTPLDNLPVFQYIFIGEIHLFQCILQKNKYLLYLHPTNTII